MTTTRADGGRYGDWEQVVEVRTPLEAGLVVLRLKDAGIEAQIIDQSFELMPLPDNQDFEAVRVIVPAEKAEEARVLLSQPVDLPEDAEIDEGEEPAE